MLRTAVKDLATMDADASLTTQQKALALNLDPATYGGFAEIGGGQEVARWFFSVGSAATGVAKAISAYDMAVSDGLYGRAPRYVSRQRLEAMLDHEFAQLLQQLGSRRGDTTTFFALANTVATRSHGRPENGHGWMGVRFQAHPHDPPSEIVLHVHLLDASALHEKEALGILGVNLLYGAFYQRETPEARIGSLVNDLSRQRVEIDMISFSGPAFTGIDNRLMGLAARSARAHRRRHVHGDRRGRSALRRAASQADPDRARKLPARHQAHARSARAGAPAVCRGAPGPRRGAGGAGRDDAPEPERRASTWGTTTFWPARTSWARLAWMS